MSSIRRVASATFAILLLFSTWAMTLPAWAAPSMQEENVIHYGETKNGELTNREFEQPWTLEGKAGDIIAFSAICEGFSGYLFLQNSEAEILAEVDVFTAFDFGANPFYVMKLPADDTYAIIVTRQGGRTGSGEGKYDLKLEKMALTPWTIPTTINFDPEEHALVYVVFEVDAPQVIQLDYKAVFGDFRPELSLAIADQDDMGKAKLNPLFTVSGSNLKAGVFSIELPSAGLYLVTFERGWGSYENEPGVYDITINPAE